MAEDSGSQAQLAQTLESRLQSELKAQPDYLSTAAEALDDSAALCALADAEERVTALYNDYAKQGTLQGLVVPQVASLAKAVGEISQKCASANEVAEKVEAQPENDEQEADDTAGEVQREAIAAARAELSRQLVGHVRDFARAASLFYTQVGTVYKDFSMALEPKEEPAAQAAQPSPPTDLPNPEPEKVPQTGTAAQKSKVEKTANKPPSKAAPPASAAPKDSKTKTAPAKAATSTQAKKPDPKAQSTKSAMDDKTKKPAKAPEPLGAPPAEPNKPKKAPEALGGAPPDTKKKAPEALGGAPTDAKGKPPAKKPEALGGAPPAKKAPAKK